MAVSAQHDPSHPLVLVVDDDEEIGDLLRRYLSGQGLRVELYADAASLRRRMEGAPADLVLLDLGLPDDDGLNVIRDLRRWNVPVIIVSGRGESVERIVGLELGADDYVTKPFDLRELLARIRSVLRRSSGERPDSERMSAAAPFEFEGFRLEPEARRLTYADGREVALTTGEFELLHALLQRPNLVLSRDQLMNTVHGRDAGPYDRAIDVQIGRLRRKIETDPANPRLIKSVRGAGYLFAVAVVRRN
ncbi:MAG: response regulator [Xanthomonadaceae bacterium]|nr:response regulator [Xanthomonadaceae bacterium]